MHDEMRTPPSHRRMSVQMNNDSDLLFNYKPKNIFIKKKAFLDTDELRRMFLKKPSNTYNNNEISKLFEEDKPEANESTEKNPEDEQGHRNKYRSLSLNVKRRKRKNTELSRL